VFGSPPPTRVVGGVVLPAVGRWNIDSDHAYVGFSARRLAVSSVRVRFTAVSGYVEIADDPAASSVEVVVATASVASGSADCDHRLRSAEHLDVARHPTATFHSSSTRWDGPRATVAGLLTLVGVTNTVELDVTYRGTAIDPWGAQRSAFSAAGVIDREDWGLTWNVTLDGGGRLVSRDVRLAIELETVYAPAS
jgi:polyisoprenoid-binding protein YceI